MMGMNASHYDWPRPLIDRSGDRAEDHATRLEERLDRALLTMEALWTLLRDGLGVTEAQLADRITDLDLRDGVLDGKARRPPLHCPGCERPTARRFPRCLYCGQALKPDPFA